MNPIRNAHYARSSDRERRERHAQNGWWIGNVRVTVAELQSWQLGPVMRLDRRATSGHSKY